MDISKNMKMIRSTDCRVLFRKLYGTKKAEAAALRYENIIDVFVKRYKSQDFQLFSSPGRVEIGGNHTDHNFGKVLGGSITFDIAAAAAANQTPIVNIYSERFGEITISLSALESNKTYKGSRELAKGVLRALMEMGYKVGGFDAYLDSSIIKSAGVSSSAAFENILCQIVSTLFNQGSIEPRTYAYAGQFAENIYWKKASGLLDQLTCGIGGILAINFVNPEDPLIRKIDFRFEACGYNIILVQTGNEHEDFKEEYSAIPHDMNKIAGYFGYKGLGQVFEEKILFNLQSLRAYAGDRAVMRALHFYAENGRVENEIEALRSGNFDKFLDNVKESGDSSWKYLQNCYSIKNPEEQGICIGLAISELFIKRHKRGACRVHGGGFGGVIMAIIPEEITSQYVFHMENLLGKGCAYVTSIRPYGSACLNELL